MSSTSPQAQVCQTPRSLCRIEGRDPYKRALRINSLGNVSAGAEALSGTGSSLPQHAASYAVLLPRYENTDAGRSSLGVTERGLNYSAALRNCPEPPRNCSRKAASSALAATKCRALTE